MLRRIAVFCLALLASIWVMGSLAAGAEEASQASVQVFYVAPEPQGKADGSSIENAAYFRDLVLWYRVQLGLRNSPVTVNFLAGQYVFSKTPKNGQTRGTLRLDGYGNPKHRLVLQGEDGTVFTSDPDEPINQNNSIDLFYFHGQNAVIRNLHFTGQQHMGYATRFLGQNILIENCSWIDLPRVYYGATGTAYETTHHITFKNGVWKRVGLDSHSHMIYNAYGPKHIYVIDSYFEDCAGEYVRFRDQTDYVVVWGNTFKSTGTYTNGNMPFISVPLFNDSDPAKPAPGNRFEYFGTHFLVANNTFIYPDNNSGGTRLVFRFLQSGFDPPGRQLLLDMNSAKTLLQGSIGERRSLLEQNMGIKGEHVHFFGNKYEGPGAKHAVWYYSNPNYGAKSRGWTSPIEITAAVNETPVVATVEEALQWWEKAK